MSQIYMSDTRILAIYVTDAQILKSYDSDARMFEMPRFQEFYVSDAKIFYIYGTDTYLLIYAPDAKFQDYNAVDVMLYMNDSVKYLCQVSS